MPKYTEAQTVAYYNSRPRKAVGAGILFFNKKGEVLILKPSYLDRWLWVGGGVEENESPLQGALRECEEEIGVRPGKVTLAFVNYLPLRPNGQLDGVYFVFAAPDPVGDDFIEQVRLDKEEIEEAKFVSVDLLSQYLSPWRVSTIQGYVERKKAGYPLYFEDGVLVF